MSKKKRSKIIELVVAIIIAIYLISTPSPQPNPNDPVLENVEGTLNIHYIDVGQADSILITLNDSSMLIDAGNNADGSTVVNYLEKQGISKLDYLIGTHPHEDHIGGLDNVIKNFEIETILMPKVQNNTKTFEDVLDAISNKKLSITTPVIGDSYKLSDAKFTILSCKNESSNELNLVSVVIRLDFGTQSYLFCGDAETENEKEMIKSGLSLKSNIIKLGHHGSSTSSMKEFLVAVDPEIAIISVGEGNDYGHPHKETISKLKNLGIETYRTDLCGTIVVSSDGKTNKLTFERED